jgi:predicted nicotinamide N-methyase
MSARKRFLQGTLFLYSSFTQPLLCTTLYSRHSLHCRSALDDKFPCSPAAFDFNSSLLSTPVDAAAVDAWMNATRWHCHETAWCRDVTGLPKYDDALLPTKATSLSPQSSEGLPLIMLRSVPSHMHKLKSQDDVGQLLWPAAAILARWIVAHRHQLFRNTGIRLLELGSGMGLAGIAALYSLEWMRASVAESKQSFPSVTLSDFNPLVLHNMVYNIKVNALEAPAGQSGTSVYAASFDWMSVAPTDLAQRVARHKMRDEMCLAAPTAKMESKDEVEPSREHCLGDLCSTTHGHALSSLHAPNTFDCIIGSDIICSVENALCVAASLSAMLRKPSTGSTVDPGGLAVILIPSAFHRWGVEAFPGLFNHFLRNPCASCR